jgi:hypothetical protein
MNELTKLAADGSALRKRADDLAAQLADIDARLTKLETKEDWPDFYGATFLALNVAKIHRAPGVMQ